MDEFKKKIAELYSYIKEPKYFYIGIGILITLFLFLPFVKLLAVILASVFIFISFFPEHAISEKFTRLIERFKNR